MSFLQLPPVWVRPCSSPPAQQGGWDALLARFPPHFPPGVLQHGLKEHKKHLLGISHATDQLVWLYFELGEAVGAS